jgi:hypothetical protein
MTCVSIYIGEIMGFRPSGLYSTLDLLEEHARAERPHSLLPQLTPAVTFDVVRPIVSTAPGALLALGNTVTGHARVSGPVGDQAVPSSIRRLRTDA